jgi:hypothetical protein
MSDVIDRSDELDRRIAGSREIEELRKAGRHRQRLIRILGASLALDILLTGGFGWLAWRADQSARAAASLQAQAHATCLSGNEARAGQRQLWHYILDLPPTAPRTPAQQEQADRFAVYIDSTFAPRRC